MDILLKSPSGPSGPPQPASLVQDETSRAQADREYLDYTRTWNNKDHFHIVFFDCVSSLEMKNAHELRACFLIHKHNEVISAALNKAGVRRPCIFKYQGDGILLSFHTLPEALCVVGHFFHEIADVQRRYAHWDTHLQTRVGISYGPIDQVTYGNSAAGETACDQLGAALDIAHRICSMAAPNEILVGDSAVLHAISQKQIRDEGPDGTASITNHCGCTPPPTWPDPYNLLSKPMGVRIRGLAKKVQIRRAEWNGENARTPQFAKWDFNRVVEAIKELDSGEGDPQIILPRVRQWLAEAREPGNIPSVRYQASWKAGLYRLDEEMLIAWVRDVSQALFSGNLEAAKAALVVEAFPDGTQVQAFGRLVMECLAAAAEGKAPAATGEKIAIPPVLTDRQYWFCVLAYLHALNDLQYNRFDDLNNAVEEEAIKNLAPEWRSRVAAIVLIGHRRRGTEDLRLLASRLSWLFSGTPAPDARVLRVFWAWIAQDPQRVAGTKVDKLEWGVLRVLGLRDDEVKSLQTFYGTIVE